MRLAQGVLAINDDLPIRTPFPVHSGKVRSVYWLSEHDSQRLIEEKNYDVPLDTPLAIMVISDRLSAFDCVWKAEDGLTGVPGKGAALNAISNHWFNEFKAHGLANSHILDIPHPFVWIVQKARPIKVEAICRQYITGSMWRSYAKGTRSFCGIALPENLTQNQRLDDLLLTPSTKGIIKGVAGVPEQDDTNISKQQIIENLTAFSFNNLHDIEEYETLLTSGFQCIQQSFAKLGLLLVDTKFEFGYVKGKDGQDKLIYMDEVGTPDSSRIWDEKAYQEGIIVENSKEGFRQFLLQHFPDPDVLLNPNRMKERSELAKNTNLPMASLLDVSETYRNMAEKITGKTLVMSENPKAEIIETLSREYRLIK